MKLPVQYNTLSFKERRAVRNQYVQLQGGLCYWCKKPLHDEPSEYIKNKKINWRLFPPNFMRYPIHLQHDHSTDLTEGAVHARCNAYMWQYHNK